MLADTIAKVNHRADDIGGDLERSVNEFYSKRHLCIHLSMDETIVPSSERSVVVSIR